MSKPILVPDPRLQPPNFGVGETYSWVQVGGVPERQMYARATYVTNLADLVLNLSATDVRIGGVEIVDNDSGLRCDVTSFEYEDGSFNALRVTTQDLEPIYDGVAIGDQYGNMVTVNESTSSLNVNVTNFLELSSIIQTNRITSLLEALTAREYDININAQDININTDEVEGQLRTTITLLNSLTSVDYSTTFKQNQLITLLTVLTAKETSISFDVSAINVNTDEVESLIKKSNTLLSTLTSVNYATAANQNTELTLLRTLTSVNYATATNQNTELTLLRTLTSNSVYGTLQIQPMFVTGSLSATVLNSVSAFSITNQLTGITVLNPITAVEITNNVSVYASTALPISGAVTIIDPVSAFSITNQLTGITVLNPITAVEITNTITVTGAVTIIDPLSAISIVNQLSAFTITNPVTAVDILNTVTVNGDVTIVNPVTAVSVINSIALKDVNNNDVTVVASTSSLNVNVTNFLQLSSILSTERITSLLEALTAREYDININAQDINVNTDEVESQLRTIITLLNSLTATSEYGTTPTHPLSTFDLTPARNANAAIDWNTIPVIATINTFTPLESYSCNVVTVYNSSTDTINIKRTGNGYAIPLQKDSSIVINVIGNANEISAFSSTSELTASALVTKF